MSNGIPIESSKHIDNDEYERFKDAAQAIFFKYQLNGTIRTSDGTSYATENASKPIAPGRKVTVVQSRACTIL